MTDFFFFTPHNMMVSGMYLHSGLLLVEITGVVFLQDATSLVSNKNTSSSLYVDVVSTALSSPI